MLRRPGRHMAGRTDDVIGVGHGPQRTAHVAGARHSVPLIAFTFGLALVDCTTSVVRLPCMHRHSRRQLFWPFASWFRSDLYVVALAVGEGLTGLVCARVRQSSLHRRRLPARCSGFRRPVRVRPALCCVTPADEQNGLLISIEVYFALLGAVMALACAAFLVLHLRCRRQLRPSAPTSTSTIDLTVSRSHDPNILVTPAGRRRATA